MTKTNTRLLSFLALVVALAVDPLSSVTDAQDGTAGQAPGEAPRPDVLPRGALLTGDVVTDAALGPISVRVERVPGAGDHVRLIAKSTGREGADIDVEVACDRTTGSLASRMGPMPMEIAKERHHVHVAAGAEQVIALTTAAPVPAPPSGADSAPAFMRETTWWSYRIRLLGAQYENAAEPLVASAMLEDARPLGASGLAAPPPARVVAAVVPQRGGASK